MISSNKTNIDQLLATASIDAKLSVNTHFLYTVAKVSEDGKFVDLISNTLEWTPCTNGDVVMTNAYGEEVLCSPNVPDVLFDIPVKQYKEGDFHIRKRPKVGDVGYIEVFYQDIGTWKDNGGFQAPQSINIMDKNSCVFVNGLIAHNEDEDVLPPQNVMQIKGRTTTIEMQDATPEDQETGTTATEAKITAKIGDNYKIELSTPSDSGLENPSVATIKVGTTVLTLTVPTEGDATVTLTTDKLNITAEKGVTITGDTTITGDLNVSKTVTATTDCVGGGISLKDHTHPFKYTAGVSPYSAPDTEGTSDKPS